VPSQRHLTWQLLPLVNLRERQPPGQRHKEITTMVKWRWSKPLSTTLALHQRQALQQITTAKWWPSLIFRSPKICQSSERASPLPSQMTRMASQNKGTRILSRTNILSSQKLKCNRPLRTFWESSNCPLILIPTITRALIILLWLKTLHHQVLILQALVMTQSLGLPRRTSWSTM